MYSMAAAHVLDMTYRTARPGDSLRDMKRRLIDVAASQWSIMAAQNAIEDFGRVHPQFMANAAVAHLVSVAHETTLQCLQTLQKALLNVDNDLYSLDAFYMQHVQPLTAPSAHAMHQVSTGLQTAHKLMVVQETLEEVLHKGMGDTAGDPAAHTKMQDVASQALLEAQSHADETVAQFTDRVVRPAVEAMKGIVDESKRGTPSPSPAPAPAPNLQDMVQQGLEAIVREIDALSMLPNDDAFMEKARHLVATAADAAAAGPVHHAAALSALNDASKYLAVIRVVWPQVRAARISLQMLQALGDDGTREWAQQQLELLEQGYDRVKQEVTLHPHEFAHQLHERVLASAWRSIQDLLDSVEAKASASASPPPASASPPATASASPMSRSPPASPMPRSPPASPPASSTTPDPHVLSHSVVHEVPCLREAHPELALGSASSSAQFVALRAQVQQVADEVMASRCGQARLHVNFAKHRLQGWFTAAKDGVPGPTMDAFSDALRMAQHTAASCARERGSAASRESAVPILHAVGQGSFGCFFVPGLTVERGALVTLIDCGSKVAAGSGVDTEFLSEVKLAKRITQDVDPEGLFTAGFVDAGVMSHVRGKEIVLQDCARMPKVTPFSLHAPTQQLFLTQIHVGTSIRKGVWQFMDVLRNGAHLCRGMAKLHAHGIAHFDLHAENIVSRVEGGRGPVWRFIDFGLHDKFDLLVYGAHVIPRGCMLDLLVLRSMIPAQHKHEPVRDPDTLPIALSRTVSMEQDLVKEDTEDARRYKEHKVREIMANARPVLPAWQRLLQGFRDRGATGQQVLQAQQFPYDVSALGTLLMAMLDGLGRRTAPVLPIVAACVEVVEAMMTPDIGKRLTAPQARDRLEALVTEVDA